jgi:hypothetical protein
MTPEGVPLPHLWKRESDSRPRRNQTPPSQTIALSTQRHQAGIFVDVHPRPTRVLKLRNLSFLAWNRMDNLLRPHI